MRLSNLNAALSNKIWDVLNINDDSFYEILVDYTLSKLSRNPKAQRFVEEMAYVPKFSEKLELLKIATRMSMDGEIHIKPYNPLINSKIRFMEAGCPKDVDYYNELNGCSSAALDVLKAYRNMSGATTFGNSVSYIFALDKRTRPLHKALETISDKKLKNRAAYQLFDNNFGFASKDLFQEILDGKETFSEQGVFYKEHKEIVNHLYEEYAKLKGSSYFFPYPNTYSQWINRYEAYDVEPGFGKRCHRTADQLTVPFAKYLVDFMYENVAMGSDFYRHHSHRDIGQKFFCAIVKFDKNNGLIDRKFNIKERLGIYKAMAEYPLQKPNEIMDDIMYYLFENAKKSEPKSPPVLIEQCKGKIRL